MSDDSSGPLVEYGIDDRPPLTESVFLGVQHYLTMVGANVAVPLIPVGALGMPAEFVPRLVGTFFVVAALFEVVVGYLGLVGRLRRCVSPVVIAPVIVLIGLTPFEAPQVTTATRNWPLLLFTLGLIVPFSQYLGDRSRAFQLFPVSLGIVADTVFVVGSTGISVGGLVAVVLDDTVPGTDRERGLEDWAETAAADAEFLSAYDRFVRSSRGD